MFLTNVDDATINISILLDLRSFLLNKYWALTVNVLNDISTGLEVSLWKNIKEHFYVYLVSKIKIITISLHSYGILV